MNDTNACITFHDCFPNSYFVVFIKVLFVHNEEITIKKVDTFINFITHSSKTDLILRDNEQQSIGWKNLPTKQKKL